MDKKKLLIFIIKIDQLRINNLYNLSSIVFTMFFQRVNKNSTMNISYVKLIYERLIYI